MTGDEVMEELNPGWYWAKWSRKVDTGSSNVVYSETLIVRVFEDFDVMRIEVPGEPGAFDADECSASGRIKVLDFVCEERE